MNAAEALKAARAVGITVNVDGDDLVLEAPAPPPTVVLDALSRHKSGVVALLRPVNDTWSAEDWQAFFDERAAIAEFDGERSRDEAESIAFECCIIEWLNRLPVQSDPDRCAWCDQPDRDGHVVVPFGTESCGHIWLHPECWDDWHQDQRERAQRALVAYGLDAPLI